MRWRKAIAISKEIKKDLLEGSFSLMLCNVGDYISGFYLQYFESVIAGTPLLLALLPAASDARGDIYSSYGSRLGTLLHLGLYDRYRVAELLALLTIVVLANFWVGILVFIVGLVFKGFGLPLSELVFISLLSAMISAAFMIPATTALAMVSFKKGLDPDNLVAPIATLFGDVVTIPTIILSYFVALRLSTFIKDILSIIMLCTGIVLLTLVSIHSKRSKAFRRCFKVVKENLLVIMLSTSFSALAGAVLLANLSPILEWKGIIAVVPAFLEDGGAIACRFSSRLTTMLHLGRVKPEPIPKDKWVYSQIGVNYVHALLVFTSLGGFGAAMALIARGTLMNALIVFSVVEVAGLVLTTIVSALAYFLAVASFKLGIDPDNVLAPVLTSVADALGTTVLVSTLLFMTSYLG